jgi:predicted nucleotidyltransferase
MSVISYLDNYAKNAVLSKAENNSIQTSIVTLKARLDMHFENLKEHIQFGSSTRGTILPRAMDERSDIDLMIVFRDSNVTPQTYLDRLRKFVEKYYKQSEVRQSHPTIVLELNHIKFELVPARYSYWSGYEIPDIKGSWHSTDPNGFNRQLTEKNKFNDNLIKPTIRLAKYWNVKNGYVFDSYWLEKYIIDLNFFWTKTNQRDYLFNVFKKLPTNLSTQRKRDKLNRAIKLVELVIHLEKTNSSHLAELEVRKLIPICEILSKYG